MTRRFVILALVLVVGTTVLSAALEAGGPTAATTRPASAPPSPRGATADAPVRAALAGVQRAFDAGDVRELCRPGALVDPAVIRLQAPSGGCENELETLAGQGPMHLTVLSVKAEPDLATATVRTAHGTVVPVDLVRSGHRWLLSFSDGADPMSALTS